jgi:uncharacterized protein (DUF1800 family)
MAQAGNTDLPEGCVQNTDIHIESTLCGQYMPSSLFSAQFSFSGLSYKSVTDATKYKTDIANTPVRCLMQVQNVLPLRRLLLFPLLLGISLTLSACGGGGGGGSSNDSGGIGVPVAPAPTPPEQPPAPVKLTSNEAGRFLSQATFGPNTAAIADLIDKGAEQWMVDEFEKPASLHLAKVLAGFPEDGSFLDEMGMPLPEVVFLASDSFWQTAVEGNDQLRQRMAFALSQILVISVESNLGRVPQSVAHYMDILTEGAFGNYRDLLENVTYSPAMSIYLTYLRNEKADPLTGRVPDENYARELMQLFTLGLVELNPDGTPVTNSDGSQIELYDNSDITEAAKVFTGLSFSNIPFQSPLRALPIEAFYTPLSMFNDFHSTQSKTFLDVTIPEGTGGEQTIDMALDAIFDNTNVGPFIGRQLIQRFVTSAPSTAYVTRVAAAFDSGRYELPSGDVIGNSARGDLQAVIAAILFDSEARDATLAESPEFGKLREPILRFTHWARAFEVNSADASNEQALRNTARSDSLGQQAYRSPSVFNFYRPGYIAAGTETGAAELTAPELQITNASSIVGYANIMTTFARGVSPLVDRNGIRNYQPDYSAQIAVAADTDALLDNLDLLLTHGTLRDETRTRAEEILAELPTETDQEKLLRVRLASVLVMTSPEYIVLR